MNSIRAVFFYEWRRSLTAARIIWWFVLALFPVAISLLIRMQPDFARNLRPEEVDTIWSIVFYLLIPCVCCALGVFLNAAPAIAAELEQRSWVYLATRPRGILWLMLGKYLVAVVWSVTSALFAISLASIVSQMDFAGYRGDLPPAVRRHSVPTSPDDFETSADLPTTATRDDSAGVANVPPQDAQGDLIRLLGSGFVKVFDLDQNQAVRSTWYTIARLSVLSSCAYAALFLMIGAVFPKRAMVFGVAYIALVEVVLSLIPAVINRITIQYRLRSLMLSWADPVGQDQMQNNMFFKYVFAEGGDAEQIVWLVGLTVVFLVSALTISERREFTAAAESDI